MTTGPQPTRTLTSCLLRLTSYLVLLNRTRAAYCLTTGPQPTRTSCSYFPPFPAPTCARCSLSYLRPLHHRPLRRLVGTTGPTLYARATPIAWTASGATAADITAASACCHQCIRRHHRHHHLHRPCYHLRPTQRFRRIPHLGRAASTRKCNCSTSAGSMVIRALILTKPEPC